MRGSKVCAFTPVSSGSGTYISEQNGRKLTASLGIMDRLLNRAEIPYISAMGVLQQQDPPLPQLPAFWEKVEAPFLYEISKFLNISNSFKNF